MVSAVVAVCPLFPPATFVRPTIEALLFELKALIETGCGIAEIDSLLEEDGFEPSVPGVKEPVSVAEGELRGIERDQPKKSGFLSGYRRFESISLQRRVGCELDFLNHGRRRPFVCHDMAFGIWVGLSPKETRSRGWD